jgi:hypothetical protein
MGSHMAAAAGADGELPHGGKVIHPDTISLRVDGDGDVAGRVVAAATDWLVGADPASAVQ